MKELNKNIKDWRLKKSYTLSEMADKLGVTEATFQRYESGLIKNIKYDHILKIAEIYNIPPQKLMGWDEEDDIISKYNLDEYELAEYNRIMDMNLLMFNNKKISENDKEKLEKTLKEIFVKSLLRKREEENK